MLNEITQVAHGRFKRGVLPSRARAASAGNGKAGTELRSGKDFFSYHENPEKLRTRRNYLRSFSFLVTAW